MKKKSLITLLCVLIAVTLVLAACSSPPAPAPATQAPATQAPAAPEAPTPEAPAEKWKPEKQITLVVPTNPGDYYDSQARIIGAEMEKILGKPVVIEYMPGAGHAVAAEYVYGADPDGYTIGYCALLPTVINDLVYDRNYDFMGFTYFPTCMDQAKDKAFLSVPGATKGDSVFNSWEDVPKFDKPIRWASVGEGSVVHVTGLVLSQAYGFEMIQVLGYTGGPDCVTAVARGESDLTTMTIDVIRPFIEAGDVKPLLTIGPARSDEYPDVPSLSDDHPEMVPLLTNRHFVVGPPNMPPEIAEALEEAIWAAVSSGAMEELHKTSISDGRMYGPARGADTLASVELYNKLFQPLLPLFDK